MVSDFMCVWVSEIMLQQTRVDTVIPYFTNFMREFPSMEALAEADEERILKAWDYLSYRMRSVWELRQYLQEKERKVEHIEAAIEELLKHAPIVTVFGREKWLNSTWIKVEITKEPPYTKDTFHAAKSLEGALMSAV